MSLLSGTIENHQVKINCTASIPQQEVNRYKEVKFIAVFNPPKSMEDVREIAELLADPDDEYGDKQLVEDHFERFEKMPLGKNIPEEFVDGKYLLFCDDTRDAVLSDQYYFVALAKAAAQMIFGDLKGKNSKRSARG